MKILWITNIVFPEAQSLLLGNGALKSSGGWLLGAAEALINMPDVKLVVASLSQQVKSLTRLEGEKITYYILPYGKGNIRINHDYEPLWKQVRDAESPDVIHIHGTEFTHGLAYVEACGANHVCVSIQGLVSAISLYYYAGLTHGEIRRSATLYSTFHGGLFSAAKSFQTRGECEKELLRKVGHIIGRTTWDKAHTWAINPQAEYHYAGETLRKSFYEEPFWQYERCVPHSIFLSQAGSPIKGLHMVLKALPIVLKHYPDTTIRVAGFDICKCESMVDRLRISDYGKMLRTIIKKNGLEGKVTFTGPLDGDGMRREYLSANVFICPSAIENSPNSLGEAQLLGVPVLASYVGGIPDMMKGDEDHLYRFEEVEMLAQKMCQIFSRKEHHPQTSIMREQALNRHDSEKNVKELIGIYQSIVQRK